MIRYLKDIVFSFSILCPRLSCGDVPNYLCYHVTSREWTMLLVHHFNIYCSWHFTTLFLTRESVSSEVVILHISPREWRRYRRWERCGASCTGRSISWTRRRPLMYKTLMADPEGNFFYILFIHLFLFFHLKRCFVLWEFPL